MCRLLPYEATGGEPVGIIIGGTIAITAVAEQGDDAAGLARSSHFVGDGKAGPDIGAGRSADAAAEQGGQGMHRTDGVGIFHRDHAVNDGRHEAGFDTGATDALNA